ncbi:protein-associating with the carboxyl-terminal domain of ezrin isoform X4 [Canis lupus baileyi]|uniref:Protein-associating with the carboxyl-terminal domain of ezrin n=3 Tax=Canis lupus TaxID=9612 RepID=A0A8C0PIF1_CANLF|nr:protein-associating with the carboxyl-terminal domain of ezrin isoform X3 [Canis lupus familiaris]XP_025286199.1 protein-associating with the carboxyl-terminal domain of ezrin isoform X4 [Canis lupus dingo]XP_035575257.1 protein-associating with the carboxyl-terminal domain of ezrin isoform X4 [Canis lupus dingo]XP_038398517.1 protein-associating with the carboxyl-terminal domain of ezrin isoform X3 [Canis lupus familiaris]XP_038527347.1 protein-associating with the carboxyl-terminal domain |eukprot:XP_022276806.1 protein-associating with the carboxyl-terminal domain of ezrin isoform X4 [Canis lupus familiaris]
MGSESSALKSYTLKEPPFTLPSGLAVYPAVLQDGKCASVFVYKRENEDKVNKAAKHLKTLRHPCLLRFLSCTVEADGIHLVTERVQPLEVALEMLSSAEVCAGIYDILLALTFLHDRGHLTHNNVCLSSVFVSEDGHWKLGGMETVCKVLQATPEFLRSIQSVRDPASIPPEEMSPEFTTLPESHGHARDAYAFGTLVESLLTILSEQVSADVLSSFQQTLHSTLLNPIPNRRPALCTLLSHDFFRNDFLEVVNFLKSLTLKSEEEKTEFFKFLLDRVSCLSEELIASRLVPLLLNQLVFAEPVAVKSFLPHLLGPKKDSARGQTPCLLSPALFQSRVIPVLLQLFEVHEEHVRMVLLSHLEAYVEHFTQEQLKKVILPQVLLGLRDTSDSIVAITLHSLAVLVSLLGPEVVVGGERTKIFKRTAPGFTKTVNLSPEGDKFPQPIKFPMNGVSDVKNNSGDGENFPPDSKKSEEWPDWSEPEEPENKTVSIQSCPTEAYKTSTSPLTNLNMEEAVAWDDYEPSSTDTEISARDGVPAVRPGTSGEQEAIPTLLSLTEESRPLKSSPPQKTNHAQSRDNPDQTKPPNMSSQERRLKAPSELGLGEEFTIQVKKKPVQDPELDWFADMIPEIKPSAAILILPELRTEMMVSNKDDVSTVMQFSSKFAAAEITEGESEGWGDEGELNWEDNNW